MLVTQPYRVDANPRVADPVSLDKAWTAVWAHLAATTPLGPIIAGGRSVGSQVACRTAAERGAAAALMLAYPLRGPGSRTELTSGSPPALVVQGTADPFGTPADISPTSTGSSASSPRPHGRGGRRAANSGGKVVELLARHGYLIHRFLSPFSNHRTDDYRSSFENRARFALRVVDAVRAVWPEELPLFVRVAATDWLTEKPEDARESWTVDDTARLARELKNHGVDLLNVSSGGLVPDAKIAVGPGYRVPFAARLRAEAGIPVAAVGIRVDRTWPGLLDVPASRSISGSPLAAAFAQNWISRALTCVRSRRVPCRREQVR